MAKIEIVTLTDSLDERIKSGVETVTFFHPGTGEKLEIELGDTNRRHFLNHLDKLTKYVEAARKVEVATPAKPAVKADGRNAEIRVWAQAHGFQVGDRGRIKAEIIKAFDDAQKQATAEKIMGEPEVEITVSANRDGEAVTEQVDSEPAAEVKSEQEDEPSADDLAEIENSSDPTATMSSEEFAAFLVDNMTTDGKVPAQAVTELVSTK